MVIREVKKANRAVSYTFFSIYMFYPIISRFITEFSHVTMLFLAFSLISSFIVFLINKPTYREKRMLIIFYVVSFLLAALGHDQLPLFAVCSMAVVYKCNIEKGFRYGSWLALLGFVFVAALSYFFGFKYSDNMFNGSTGEVIRWSMGFQHPNYAGFLFALIIMSFIVAYRQNFLSILILGSISYIVYLGNKSRTLMIFALLIIVLYFPFMWIYKGKSTRKILYLLFPAMIILSFVVARYFYADDNKINVLLSGRPWYMHEYLTKVTPSLFGSSLVDELWLDNLYFVYLYDGGIVKFIFQIIINALGIFCIEKSDCKKEEKARFYFIYFIYLLLGFTSNISSIYFTPVHIIFALSLFKHFSKYDAYKKYYIYKCLASNL